MDSKINFILTEIQKLRSCIDALERVGPDFPALDRNLKRISASIKMLELNFVDPQQEDLYS